jgi:histidyl-tRNA synthetase
MAQTTYRSHHGMNDILPDEAGKWQALEQLIHREAKKIQS